MDGDTFHAIQKFRKSKNPAGNSVIFRKTFHRRYSSDWRETTHRRFWENKTTTFSISEGSYIYTNLNTEPSQ